MGLYKRKVTFRYEGEWTEIIPRGTVFHVKHGEGPSMEVDWEH